jgi:hypothetical protein
MKIIFLRNYPSNLPIRPGNSALAVGESNARDELKVPLPQWLDSLPIQTNSKHHCNVSIQSSNRCFSGFGKGKVYSETVEKVPKQTLGGDAEKNDFTESATINDLTTMKGCETPKNQVLTIVKGFSTVSAGIETSQIDSFPLSIATIYYLFIAFSFEYVGE